MPPSAARESTTRSSGCAHHGHRIAVLLRDGTTTSGAPTRLATTCCDVNAGENGAQGAQWVGCGMPSELELILRLLLAGALAGALGVERELTEQPAGFRTHILVGVGAALFAVISAFGFQAIAGQGPSHEIRADVPRVASQIVVGI